MSRTSANRPQPGAALSVPPGPGLPQGLRIDAGELVERFSRASGPGGQGVNTTDSRVELELDPASCAAVAALPEPVRDIIVGSVTHVILLSTGIVVLALLATLMVPELPMASRQPAAPKGEPPPDAHL